MVSCEKMIQEALFSMRDEGYKEFNCKLIPTVDKNTVIGVRTPALRAYAKEIAGSSEAEEFLKILPHKYYEENNLHGFLIERIKDYDKAVGEIDRFLPYIDNWATCDLISPKMFKKHTGELYKEILKWTSSTETYTIRFGVEMLMSFYLDDLFKPEYNALVSSINSEEYYVNMMLAWYFATALAKQYDKTLPFIENKRLRKWVHNKSIQKAVESYRLTPEQKVYLKTLKIK